MVQEDKLNKISCVLLLIGFGLGFSFSSYQVAQEKQRKEKAELQAKVDRCTGWANRFLTLKNGDNYTEELKGKYVDICLEITQWWSNTIKVLEENYNSIYLHKISLIEK